MRMPIEYRRFLKQGSIITLLQVFSKLFSLAGSAWAARCLGPENMGISGLVFVLMEPFFLITNLRLEVYLVREYAKFSKEGSIGKIVNGFFTFQLLNAVFILAVIAVVLLLAGTPQVWHLSLAAGIPVYLLASTQPKWILQAKSKMVIFYVANAILAIVNAALVFIFFKPGMAAGSDLVVYLVGVTISTLVMWWFALDRNWPRLQFDMLKAIWGFCRANILVLITGGFTYILTSLGAPLLAWLGSVEDLGLYRTALILVASITTFLSIVHLLVYPQFVTWYQQDVQLFRKRQNQLVLCFVLFAIILSLGAFFLSPVVFPLIFGAQFSAASYPFILLISGKAVLVVSSLYTFGFWARGQTKIPLYVIAPIAIASVIANFLWIPTSGMMAVSAIYLIGEILILLGLALVNFVTLQNKNT